MTHLVKLLLFVIVMMLAVVVGLIMKSWVPSAIFTGMVVLPYHFTTLAMITKSNSPVYYSDGINISIKLSIVVIMLISTVMTHYCDGITTLLGSIGALCGILLAVESH